jgi:HD-GYP domain-containing protein (c-di-GMP phosphodiesterase class II)
MGLARLAGISTAWSIDLGVAALVHDIGKLLLPPEVMSRELESTGDELEPIFDHPRIGLAAVLANPLLPPLASIVTLEHHLNYNGTGYPQLARRRRPHPATLLVTVADCFVVLFTARGGRGLLTREGTILWLEEHSGTVLDPNWAGALKDMLDRPPVAAQPPG